MSIKVQCDHCGAGLTVKDNMAGKQGKCPKCSGMLQIPAAASAAEVTGDSAGVASGGGWGQNVRTPMDDLLDEAGVKGVSTGPTCPNCAADIEPNAVLCVECGFNFTVGRQMRTQAYTDDGHVAAGMTETEKIMAKAEREIDSDPIEFDEVDHGDGPDSFLIALGMMIVFGVLVAVGIATVFFMDQITTSSVTSFLISYGICGVLMFISWLWLTIVAFMEKIASGVAILMIMPISLVAGVCSNLGADGNVAFNAIGGFFGLIALGLTIYMWIYGFGRFNALWIPTLMHITGFLGAFAINIAFRFGWIGGGV